MRKELVEQFIEEFALKITDGYEMLRNGDDWGVRLYKPDEGDVALDLWTEEELIRMTRTYADIVTGLAVHEFDQQIIDPHRRLFAMMVVDGVRFEHMGRV